MEQYLLPVITVLMLVGVLQTSYLVYRAHRKERRQNNDSIFVDTSVLMDGRILEVAKTGFITSELVIPRTVIGELQLLSDGSDSARRTRARYGLDVARELRTMDSVSVTLLQDGSSASEGVDERLLKLAKKYGGSIMTIDFNLNKVAQVEDINVLNVNELAKVIRAEHLPGERYSLDLIQKGQNQQQAVGYTKDGIMVVVDNAQKKIGTTVDVEITRAIQTDAGRMLFAKIVEDQKLLQTPKPGLAKKILSSGGRQRPQATKSKSKAASTPKPATSKKETDKPAEKSTRPNGKFARSKSSSNSNSRSDSSNRTQSTEKSPASKKAETSKQATKPSEAKKSEKVTRPTKSRADNEPRPRLYSSRSDSDSSQAKSKPEGSKKVESNSKPANTKTKGDTKLASKPSAARQGGAKSRPKRKNPEDNLMALINDQ